MGWGGHFVSTLYGLFYFICVTRRSLKASPWRENVFYVWQFQSQSVKQMNSVACSVVSFVIYIMKYSECFVCCSLSNYSVIPNSCMVNNMCYAQWKLFVQTKNNTFIFFITILQFYQTTGISLKTIQCISYNGILLSVDLFLSFIYL